MRAQLAALCLSVLIVFSPALSGHMARVLGGEPGKIDLSTADPAEIDLSTIDPARLDLSKAALRRLDLSKWDLSLIDVSRVTADEAKQIQKLLKSERRRQELLSSYAPGELDRINQRNLQWLRRPEPFDGSTPTRNHEHDESRIESAARSIDEIVLAKLQDSNQEFNPLTSDEQFVRRIYLDAAGRIPTAAETEAFLSDNRPAKRRELIDNLLLSDDYPSQMFNWLADMLRVQDLKSNQGHNSGYQAWLIDQLAGNRPWNEIVRDMLTAEGNLVTEPAVGWLDRDRGVLTNSVSNTLTTFMGANVSCAECHDHPFADWTQRDFYELTAFFGSIEVPGKNVRGAPKVLKSSLHRAFYDPEQHLTFPEDYKYDDVEPGSRVTPSFPVLADLAPDVASGDRSPGPEDFAGWMTNKRNQQFAATIANRLWRKAFGRAVLEPVTVMDDLDAADNPELIRALAGLMQDLDFDLMAFQRVLYNTRAYQAQASVSPDGGDAYRFPGPVLRRMTAEQAWDSLVTLVEGEDVNQVRRDRKFDNWVLDVFKDGAIEALDQENRVEYESLMAAAEKLSRELMSEVADGRGRTGQRRRRTAENTGDDLLRRASERIQPEEDNHFLRQFGQSERELADAGSNEGSIPQVLMLMNGPDYELLVNPDSHIMQIARNAPTASRQVELMYLSFFSRRPTEFERGLIGNERVDLSELTWILMNSREFIFIQ